MVLFTRRFFFLVFLSILFSCSGKNAAAESNLSSSNDKRVYAQQNLKPPIKIYYRLGEITDETKKYFNSKNFVESHFIDEKMFLTNVPFQVDREKLKLNLSRIFPDDTAKGICYINLESPYLEMIRDVTPDNKNFKPALTLFLEVLKIAKEHRPNVKFGYYNIPFSTYWDTLGSFLNRNDNLDPLLKEVDFLFPSLYMFYDDGIVGTIKNTEYLTSNLKKNLELGKKYNKPVVPFIMHRYHPGNEKVAWSLMNDKEWKNYISTIQKVQYKGKSIEGIFWWGADDFYYGREDGKLINKEFRGTKSEFLKYNNHNYLKKAQQIVEILNEKN